MGGGRVKSVKASADNTSLLVSTARRALAKYRIVWIPSQDSRISQILSAFSILKFPSQSSDLQNSNFGFKILSYRPSRKKRQKQFSP